MFKLSQNKATGVLQLGRNAVWRRNTFSLQWRF